MIQGLEEYVYNGMGYMPLVYSDGWMVALLNHEPGMEIDKAIEIERHIQTDEVFILLKGMAALYLVRECQPLKVVVLKPGYIYNVTKGTWHNLLATKDAVLAIVENRDTDKYDTEIRPLVVGERQAMLRQLPGWLR